MNRSRLLSPIAALAVFAGLIAPHASAQTTFYYAPVGLYVWNTTNAEDWASGNLNFPTYSAWSNGAGNNTAVFDSATLIDGSTYAAAQVTVNSAIVASTIEFATTNWSLGAGTGSVQVSTIQVANGSSATIQAAIANSSTNLAKTGGGTLTLSGGSSAAIQNLTTSAGTLILNRSASISSISSVTVSGGATMRSASGGTTSIFSGTPSLTLSGGATFDLDNAAVQTFSSLSVGIGNGIIDFSGAGGALTFGGSALGGSGNLSVSGYTNGSVLRISNLSNEDLSRITIGGQAAAYLTTALEGTLVAVPEPSTYAAIAGALVLGLAAHRRHRRRKTETA
jgi:hypothetical protein